MIQLVWTGVFGTSWNRRRTGRRRRREGGRGGAGLQPGSGKHGRIWIIRRAGKEKDISGVKDGTIKAVN